MKLIITQPELTEIVRKHIGETVQFNEGADLVIEFSATRGEDGITATIDIPYMGVSALDLSPGTAPPTPVKRAYNRVGPVARATEAAVSKADAPFATEGPADPGEQSAVDNAEAEVANDVAEVVAEEAPVTPATPKTGLFAGA